MTTTARRFPSNQTWAEPTQDRLMLYGNSGAMAIGVTMAVLLLLAGMGLGVRYARRRRGSHDESMSQNDRERVLKLLQELGAWTSEYSGNVSDYQDMLGQLSDEVASERKIDMPVRIA